jgi:hypothetical protein
VGWPSRRHHVTTVVHVSREHVSGTRSLQHWFTFEASSIITVPRPARSLDHQQLSAYFVLMDVSSILRHAVEQQLVADRLSIPMHGEPRVRRPRTARAS